MKVVGFLSDIDECKKNNDCPGNSACVNMPGSYKCQCNVGYHAVKGKCTGKVQ